MRKRLSHTRMKIIGSNEKISRRTGLVITKALMDRIGLDHTIDMIFGRPGSNRGIKASTYLNTLIAMFEDGATHLEDVSHLLEDEGYQELLAMYRLPGADALGDWLRRQGDSGGEEKVLEVQRKLFEALSGSVEGGLLDIDATIIKAEKGDAKRSYKKIRGYQPMLGVIAENGFVAASEFRQGNESPGGGLWAFIKRCEQTYSQPIRIVRSDSAGYCREVIENCLREEKWFSITAVHTVSVLHAVEAISEEQWQQGYDADGLRTGWEVAETAHTLSAKKRSFRLVAKREPIDSEQGDLFANYRYWIVATNLPREDYDSNAALLFHQQRGAMERVIGELKHQVGLNHLPCGQFGANAMYFTIGILAYNLMQAIKCIALPPEYRKKSIRTIRFQLMQLAGKITFHARYMVLQIAAPLKNINLLRNSWLRLQLSPAPA